MGFILGFLGFLWDGVQAVADAAIIALTAAWHVLSAFAGAIWDAGKFTYQNLLKPIGVFLKDSYERLKGVYDKFVKPALKWLDRVSSALRKVYDTYFRPVLSAIDGVRKLAQLLELLHVQWAKQLDDYLLQLEHKIAAPILDVIQFVNAIDSRIDSYVLTVDNLFKKATLLGSIKRDLQPVMNLWWNGQTSHLTAAQKHGPQSADELHPLQDHADTFEQVLDGDESASGLDLGIMEQVFVDAFTSGTFHDYDPRAPALG